MDTPGSETRDRRPRLALEVAVLVIAGIVLGLAYNQSMLLADDTRALTWIAKERATGVLDVPVTPQAPAPVTTAPVPATEPAATPLSTTAAHDTAKSVTHPPKKAAAEPAKAGATGKSSASSKSAPAATPAATSTSAAAAKPAASAPAIPDTREPLEAKLAVVKALHDADAAIFVDARTAEEYAAGHIAGAISMPFDDVFKKPDLAKQFQDHGKPIVTYCDGGDCTLSKDLAFSLIDNGHKKVLFYADGLPGWKAAGGAVRTGNQP